MSKGKKYTDPSFVSEQILVSGMTWPLPLQQKGFHLFIYFWLHNRVQQLQKPHSLRCRGKSVGFASGRPDSNPGLGSYQLWTEDIFLSEVGSRNRQASQGGSKNQRLNSYMWYTVPIVTQSSSCLPLQLHLTLSLPPKLVSLLKPYFTLPSFQNLHPSLCFRDCAHVSPQPESQVLISLVHPANFFFLIVVASL